MAYTFLTLTNAVLKRINEVEIASEDFAGVRGVHAMVKDAVNDAIFEINLEETEWPFNYADLPLDTVAGVPVYTLAATIKKLDFDSVFLKQDDATGAPERKLEYLTFDEYNERYAEDDGNQVRTGPPEFVYSRPDGSVGISPIPDAVYRIQFSTFLLPVPLEDHSDTPTIPETFQQVVKAGALSHVYMHRTNIDQASYEAGRFKSGIKKMRTLLINTADSVFSNRYNMK